jgi:putative flippase GtrA
MLYCGRRSAPPDQSAAHNSNADARHGVPPFDATAKVPPSSKQGGLSGAHKCVALRRTSAEESPDPTRRLFLVYAAIGAFVFVLYVGLFQLLEVSHRVPLTLASTIAYFVATATHFTLNRYANFRRFDRAIHDQARTFVAIILGQWLVTLAIVNLLAVHGVPPIVATIVAVVVNLPLGFIANRYLTFGIGIVPRLLGGWKAVK